MAVTAYGPPGARIEAPIEQVPEPPVPDGATEATHVVVPTSTVTLSVVGRTSWLPVTTVTVKTEEFSPAYATLVGVSETVAVEVSLVTVSPVGAVATVAAETSASPG